jgi:hypothetical protein
MPTDPARTPDVRVIVCHEILEVAFFEAALDLDKLYQTMRNDAGPQSGSPATLAGQILQCGRKVGSFCFVKSHFALPKPVKEVDDVAAELKEICHEIYAITALVDAEEKSRSKQRPSFTWVPDGLKKVYQFFAGSEAEHRDSDPEMWVRPAAIDQAIERLRKARDRSQAGLAKVRELKSKL